MKIAILKFKKLTGISLKNDWVHNGPYLPLEFSRVAHKGSKVDCLSLVIDPKNGTQNKTFFAESLLENLEDVIDEMAMCEKITFRESIGFVDLINNKINKWANNWYPSVCRQIKTWAAQNGFDGVVWCNLRPNFEKETGFSFSPLNANKYISMLPPEIKHNALNYIINEIPSCIETRFRTEFDVVQLNGLGNVRTV